MVSLQCMYVFFFFFSKYSHFSLVHTKKSFQVLATSSILCDLFFSVDVSFPVVFTYYTVPCFFHFRAIFYNENADAARTKHRRSNVLASKTSEKQKTAGDKDLNEPSEYVFPEEGWSYDPCKFPPVTFWTVFEHTFKPCKRVEGDDEGGAVVVMRPWERAKEFLFGGYVHDVQAVGFEKTTFVKAKCWASQKKGVIYKQKIVVQDRGLEYNPEERSAVVFASCQGCVAGTDGGLCSHVIALLMVLDRYRARKPAVTSLPCAWGPRKRDVNPEPIANVVVERSKLDAGRLGDPVSSSLHEARGITKRTITEDDVDNLWESLPSDCPMKPLLPTVFKNVHHRYGVAPLGSVLSYQQKVPGLTINSRAQRPAVQPHLFPDLPMASVRGPYPGTPPWPMHLLDAQAFERRTTEQSSSREWLDAHSYTLTAANFYKIAHCKTGAANLLGTLFERKDLSRIPAIQHGKAHEEVAATRYVELKSSQSKPVDIRSCGLVVDTSFRYIGASPDRMVFDKSARPRYGLLEIKCPHTPFMKSMSIEEAVATDKNFCLERIQGQIHLKKAHSYYYQVQGQLAVSRLKWCDFFVWVGPQNFFLERIYADEKFWLENLLPSLLAFYTDHAAPYLLARSRPTARVQQSLPSDDGSLTEGNGEEPFSDLERHLPPDQCQSLIDGRNGSNACTVIAALFVRELLQNADERSLSNVTLCRLMQDGNRLYDSLHTQNLLSADEVLDIQPSLGIQLCQESFVRASEAAVTAMLTVMSEQSSTSPEGVFGGIFVVTPYSFSMCCMRGDFILFDSHSHGRFGALLAVLPQARAVQYLKFFFDSHYPRLFFNAPGERAAHMTYLSLV